MTLQVDLFWSFRSPYSYLATGRIIGLAQQYDLEIALRPVYPIAIRTPEFFERVDPLWVAYLLADVRRTAEMLDIPFTWPDPDPVVMDMASRTIAPDQPYIHRLTFLGVAAARRGRGLQLIEATSGLLWGRAVRGWDQGDHLALAVAGAGLDLAEIEAAVAADRSTYEAAVEANQAALEAAGHWGVPTLVFDGEPFFGQDRIDTCVWRMRQNGLTRR